MKTKLLLTLLWLFFFQISQLKAANVYVNGSGTSTATGLACFTTIQSAINAPSTVNGDVINVEAGTYTENIIINKEVTITGAGQGNTFLLPAISNVGDITFPGSQFGTAGVSDIIIIRASNVVITQVTIDGSNPGISGTEATVNGVSIDARVGIIVDFTLGLNWNNILINNITVQNVFERGIQGSGPGGVTMNMNISNCNIRNVEGNAGAYGISFIQSAYTISVTNCILDHARIIANYVWFGLTINDNTITNSNIPSSTDNFNISVSNCRATTIARNTIISPNSRFSTGIKIYNFDGNHLVQDNVIMNCEDGIDIEGTSKPATAVTITSNTISSQPGGFGGYPAARGIFTTNDTYHFYVSSSINIIINGNNKISNVDDALSIEASNKEIDSVHISPGDFTNNTTATGLQLFNIANNFVTLSTQGGPNAHIPNIDATSFVFDVYGATQADGFAIEDKIHHKLDDPTLGNSFTEGMVIFRSNELFVTGNDGNTSIQRALSFVPADGWTIDAVTGIYAENITNDKNITLRSNDFLLGTTTNALTMNGAGKTLVLDAPLTVRNSLDLTDGIINTSSSINIGVATIVTGGSTQSHIKGKIQKTGNTAFTFPLGDGTNYRPCSISAPASVTDVFEAAYSPVSPKQTISSTISGTGAGSPPIVLVSDREYWSISRLNGASDVVIGLNWLNTVVSGGLTSDTHLRIANYDGTAWVNLGGIPSMAGGLIWVNSTDMPVNYGFFALSSTSILTPLPLAPLDFKASGQNNEVNLQWNNLTDQDITFYVSEKSTDGIHFYTLSTVTADYTTGIKKLYSLDTKPAKGSNYYRLRLVKKDGRIQYSDVIEFSIGNLPAVLLTNDKANQRVKCYIQPDAYRKNMQSQIFDSFGTLILKQNMASGDNFIPVNRLPSGIYFIVIADNEKVIGQLKIYK